MKALLAFIFFFSFLPLVSGSTLVSYPRVSSASMLSANAFSAADDSVYYNQVVRLKNGTIIVGRVEYDVATDRFVIKPKSGTIQTVLRREVEVIEEYSRTYLPPEYSPSSSIVPCDSRQREKEYFFTELKAWMLYSGPDESNPQIGLPEFTFGPEIVGGLRVAEHWGVGIGCSYFSARDISRIPLYLHGRYAFALDCITPFLYVQAGTVFDNQSSDHIAIAKIFSPGPKIAGFGIGIDYAIAHWLDLSADIGYRYLQLPTKVPCDCSGIEPFREAVYYNESHGVLLRVGVTF